MTIELGILIVEEFLLASVFSNHLSDRFGVPSLLFYLLIGMAAAFFLILVARPLAVLTCCLPFKLQKNETV